MHQRQRRGSAWCAGTARASRRGFGELDLTVECNGYIADACETVPVAAARQEGTRLMECARRAFHAGLERVRPGVQAFEVGAAIHREASR